MLTPELDRLFQSYFKPGEPGGAVLVAHEGKIIYQRGFGVADVNTKEPITTKTLFNIGSISKTFVAYGILKLTEQKKISLEDPLDTYFHDFKHPGIASKVKLIHLLTHTSGLPDSRKVREEKAFYLVAKDEENFAPIKNTAALEFEPGTRYKYSNPAFNALALIIESRTRRKWQEYIGESIFQQAGLKASTITDGSHPETGVSHGYVKNRQGGFDELDYGEEPTFAAAGNGGVWSSVEELWKYEQAIQSYSFLPEPLIHFSRTRYQFPGWKDSSALKLGTSWFITNEMKQDMIGHTGSQGGFISDYCWLPEKRLFYVLLCNTPVPLKEIRDKLFRVLKVAEDTD